MPAPRMRTTPLPGIGVQYDLTTRERGHLSVIAHRDGTRTVNVYRTDDPDACAQSLHLTAAESGSLIDALTPSHHSPSVLHTIDLGLVAERIDVSVHSMWNGRVLGDLRLRTETGASVVAVMRRSGAVPSPTPDFRLAGGDTLIIIGTREGVDAAAAILGQE
ncbi:MULTISPECIES: cation:proton antiporter regulatory subunit [Streptomyces]|uniref:Putative regulatory, ligand-binding protein n=1 Tax=Streptomyces albus (strain ATCC 21838 / DSM 41398 / FERM P-419 / JCM 4703 / NBRC 107858) TaxID=1081613 RepID=A0A0B5EXS1_STRA4|nr:TrkA C-terminal domain-containing protein [Streptomyces sp. SCSIO ZS0520]AJE83441.1 putative regulatory, ligand-binding protein [Streptomyces albus]AOU77750.1 putative regulatory, ligand-binding protein [Streptomyces albus]